MIEQAPGLHTYAFLWITHSDRSPHDVSKIMQISPTRIHLKEGRKAISQWILSSENDVSTKSEAAGAHLKWLLDTLGDNSRNQIAELKSLGFQVDLRLQIVLRTQTSYYFALSTETMNRLANLDVIFLCSIDCVPEDVAIKWEKSTL